MLARCKQGIQYGVPFPLFRRFERGILKTLLKAIPEKTKRARKYGIKNFKGKKKYESEV